MIGDDRREGKGQRRSDTGHANGAVALRNRILGHALSAGKRNLLLTQFSNRTGLILAKAQMWDDLLIPDV